MIGQNLKKIRESKGMSQEYVAKALNVSRQSISKWENDRAYPDIENLILLSQLYKIPIDTLLDNAVSTAESVEKIEDDQVGENFITVSMLSILLIASSFVSVIGIIVSAIFFVRTRKK